MKHKFKISNREIQELQYQNSERGFAHTPHNVDMLQYEYLKEGNMAAVAASEKVFHPEMQGHLSDDPVRNIKYLFIINTGLASRYAVEGGLDMETAYAISDLYIQRVDRMNSIDEIMMLQKEMIAHYTSQVAQSKKKVIFSKPIIMCMEYIDVHITDSFLLSDVAEYVKLNPNYLSMLFKKETGLSFSAYLQRERIEISKTLLTHSDYSFSQIASSLAFSSQSHFTKVFREHTGLTPAKYRNQYYRKSITSNRKEIYKPNEKPESKS